MSAGNKHRHDASLAAGTTMDNQLLFDVFSNVSNAAAVRALDKALAGQASRARAKPAPMQIGRRGQLQKWLQGWGGQVARHRHVLHL